MSALLIVALFGSPLGALAFGTDQTVGVRGQLMCGDKPETNADVKLWTQHTWPNTDSLLASTKTDSQGRFQLSGSESQILMTIRPEIRIYHRCNNKGIFDIPNLCQRKSVYEIPEKYISKGQQVGDWYDMGSMNLEAKQKGEDTHCITTRIGRK